MVAKQALLTPPNTVRAIVFIARGFQPFPSPFDSHRIAPAYPRNFPRRSQQLIAFDFFIYSC